MAKPDKYLPCMTVNLSHPSYLLGSLVEVLLIDTNRIYPQPVGPVISMFLFVQRRKQIEADDKTTSIHVEASVWGFCLLGVGECLIWNAGFDGYL